MNIGVISDIHGPLPEIVHEVFAGCGAILCAGDTCSLETFDELRTIAPTTMVYGNCDRDLDYGPRVADKLTPSFDGCRFALVHKLEDLGELPRRCECVISGHTHVPSMETSKGVIWLNPGSPTDPREGSNPSVAIVSVEERLVTKAAIIDLTNPWPAMQDFREDTLISERGGFDEFDEFGGMGMSDRFASRGGGSAGFDFSEIC